MGTKTSVPDYLKKKIKGTTIGGGVDLYDDPDVSVPKATLNIKKGKTTISGGAEKPFLKKQEGNLNSTLSLGITREGENSSLTFEGSKTGKSKNIGVSFTKSFKSGGLKKWFDQKWVDIGSKRKDGSYAPCGRSKLAADQKRKYPKCVPAAKAARMTDSQRKSAVVRKRAKAQGVGGKPTNVSTFTKKYYGGMIEI
jgi:hypothetical protein